MQGLIYALFFILLPFLFVLFLRTNAAILFFVLAGAATLQTYLDKDVASFTGALLGGDNTRTVSLVLLVLPFVVAAVAFRDTVGRALFFHLLLSLAVGLCLVFIVPQFLPDGVVGTIRSTTAFRLLEPYTSLVIAGTFLASVVFMWSPHPKGHHEGHGKKHSH